LSNEFATTHKLPATSTPRNEGRKVGHDTSYKRPLWAINRSCGGGRVDFLAFSPGPFEELVLRHRSTSDWPCHFIIIIDCSPAVIIPQHSFKNQRILRKQTYRENVAQGPLTIKFDDSVIHIPEHLDYELWGTSWPRLWSRCPRTQQRTLLPSTHTGLTRVPRV
jgi:hypothetical protein